MRDGAPDLDVVELGVEPPGCPRDDRQEEVALAVDADGLALEGLADRLGELGLVDADEVGAFLGETGRRSLTRCRQSVRTALVLGVSCMMADGLAGEVAEDLGVGAGEAGLDLALAAGAELERDAVAEGVGEVAVNSSMRRSTRDASGSSTSTISWA